MSSQSKNKTWVIPSDQVEEFMSKPIDYNALINDCIRRPQHRTLETIEKINIKPLKKKNKKPKSESIWTKEFTFSF